MPKTIVNFRFGEDTKGLLDRLSKEAGCSRVQVVKSALTLLAGPAGKATRAKLAEVFGAAGAEK